MPGEITRPVVTWEYYLGGPQFDVHVVRLDSGKVLLLVVGGVLVAHRPDGFVLWKSRPLGIEAVIGVDDVDRDGRTEVLCSSGKSLFVLSMNDGSILWQEYLGPPLAAGFMHTGALLHHFPDVGLGMQLAVGLLSSREVVLYDFSTGAATPERRHILWMDDFFHPSLLAVDVDGDGRDELVVTKYSAVYAFDPVTGEEKSVCRWSSGGTPKRNYGLFQARSLHAPGIPDFLVLSERVSRHIAVVENDGDGALSVRWDRFIEHIYPTDEKELRYTFNSCVDIDGNSNTEIVISTFNDRGDGRWWLEVLDAWTGSVRLRVPDLYLRGISLSGIPCLLVSRETRRLPNALGRISLLTWHADGLREEWHHDNAAFVGCFRQATARSTVFRTELPPADEIWSADIDGVPSIPLRLADGRLALLQHDSDSWRVVDVPGVQDVVAILAIEDLDGDGNTELVLSDDTGTVHIVHADGSLVGNMEAGMRYRYGVGAYYMAKPMQTPIMFVDDGVRYCAVPDGGSRIHVLKWDNEKLLPVATHVEHGRGRMGPEEMYHSVSAVELDGQVAVLMSSLELGRAVLRAVAPDGNEVRRWAFPNLPSSFPIPPGRTGIYEYTLIDGNSELPESDAASSTLVVSGYSSASMNSERTIGIDAVSGVTLWERMLIGTGEDGRGFGSWNAMSTHVGRNGNELYFLAKDTVCHVDARSGEFLHEPWQLRPYNTEHLRQRGMRMDDFAAYGSLIPIGRGEDGVERWGVLGVYGGIGVIDSNHTMLWWQSAPLSSLSGRLPGVADIDGDGLIEFGLSFADGDFVCLRADNGLEKWRLHLGQTASDVVVCDIDGDGCPEFILATDHGVLMAIGVSSSGCGLIKWQLQFEHSLGPPIVADFDGDGRSEVVVVCGDGQMYGINNK